METPKLNDRPKAEAFLRAGKKVGFYAKLGLVTSYQSGELEIDYRKGSSSSGNRKRYYDYVMTTMMTPIWKNMVRWEKYMMRA